MKNFALMGAAGYIAPRHMKAMRDTGGRLMAALDKCDSAGVIDEYFPKANFFTEFARFDRYIDKLRSDKKTQIDYVAIATPNHLHDSHVRWALRSGCNAICEKPLVLNPHNIEQLRIVENETGRKIYNILQLRFHKNITDLKNIVQKELKENPDKIYDIDLTYITSRGKWYFTSWKGEESKSGGIATNIGIHFYDMLTWIFGDAKENVVHLKTAFENAGYLRLRNANVRWFLSVRYDYIPDDIKRKGQRTYRSITVDGKEIEFSDGFTELHTRSYEEILKGKGFGLDEVYNSIEIVSQIRKKEPIGLKGEYHPFCQIVNSE